MADNPKREFKLGLLNDAISVTRDRDTYIMPTAAMWTKPDMQRLHCGRTHLQVIAIGRLTISTTFPHYQRTRHEAKLAVKTHQYFR